MDKKVIIAHPDKQHSMMTAIALKNKGVLFKYITTVYDKQGSWTHKLIKILSGKNKKKALSRKNKHLNECDIIQFCELMKLFMLFLSKMHIPICRRFKYYIEDFFGKKVAKYAIANNIDIVIMYDTTALACFRYIKKYRPSIICILDTSTVSHRFMRDTFDKNIRTYGSSLIKKEYPYIWDRLFQDRCMEEIQLSDYFLSPSMIVTQSLVYCDVPRDKILKIPYGVNIDSFKPAVKKEQTKTLRLLFVGTVNCRKGIDKIIESVIQANIHIQLDIVGEFNAKSELYRKYKNNHNIKFHGFITHDAIVSKFQEADMFVIASLAEGLTLVGLEAMGCGLPILCSQYTGVNDLVKNGINGYVFDVFKKDALKNILIDCYNNKEKLKVMGINARETAISFSCEKYNMTLIQELCSHNILQ